VIHRVDNEPGEGDELGVVHDARLSLGTKSCKHALLELALGTVQYRIRDLSSLLQALTFDSKFEGGG
jgi:hypothetical protein